MTDVYVNRITTAVPDHDIHQKFVGYAPSFLSDVRERKLFERMVKRSQIEHRYSFIEPDIQSERLDKQDFYRRGAFPDRESQYRSGRPVPQEHVGPRANAR